MDEPAADFVHAVAEDCNHTVGIVADNRIEGKVVVHDPVEHSHIHQHRPAGYILHIAEIAGKRRAGKKELQERMQRHLVGKMVLEGSKCSNDELVGKDYRLRHPCHLEEFKLGQ